MNASRYKLFLIPFILLNLLAAVGFGIEAYNRYYRGVHTPFLLPAIGLLLLSGFFVVRRRWMYIGLGVVTAIFTALFIQIQLWVSYQRPSLVYNYRGWEMDSTTGRIHLASPIGPYAPASGGYVTCNFALNDWLQYLDNQPLLCTAFDEQLRLLMYLNDNDTDQGLLREFQLNQFKVDRKSLLGEPLDRMATRIAFIRNKKGVWPRYRIKAFYQVYEREIGTGQTRVIESFSRDAQGRLKSFTESSLLNLTSKDVFAVYNDQGLLKEIPQMGKRSFAFPAKVDTSPFLHYNLPQRIRPGEI
jgi:hypothetical protein